MHLREQTARNLSQTIAIDLAYKARRGSLSQRNNVVATVWKDKKVFHFIQGGERGLVVRALHL